MNFCKLFSASICVLFLSLFVTPGSDAHHLFHPFHIFHAAKFGTLALIGKGAIVAPIVAPLLVKKAALGGAVAIGGLAALKAALVAKGILAVGGLKAKGILAVGGLKGLKVLKAGAIAGGLVAAKKAPILLAKSALPKLLSFAPLLKGLGKKKKSPVVYEQAAPVYAPAAPAYAPTYSQPIIRSGY